MKGTIKKIFLFCFLSAAIFTGCDEAPLLEKISYKVEPNLETVKIVLQFSKAIRSDLGGTYALKDHGFVEIEPATGDKPFSVGFRVSLNALYDNEFLALKPVSSLPSGQPFPRPLHNKALIQVPVHSSNNLFDLYAFIDPKADPTTAESSGGWIGFLVTLNFIDQRNFPSDVEVSRSFLKGDNGMPLISGMLFGPSKNSQGQVEKPGGIALFADIHTLIKSGKFGGGEDQGLQVLFVK